MNKTPNSNRTHITIFGKTNAGKSSLINALTGQEVSIVSSVPGTTTDSVVKAMELLPFGPVLFIDSAGLDDTTELGSLRIKKTLNELKRTDFALYLMSAEDIDYEFYEKTKKYFKDYSLKHALVITKSDILSSEEREMLKKEFPKSFFTSMEDEASIDKLKKSLVNILEKETSEPGLLEGILNYGDRVIMVVPVDSEAPKNRLILPQVQLIRECLDRGIKSYVVRDSELASALIDIPRPDLVITDSQAFAKVKEILDGRASLTSFSILFANQKGDLKVFKEGVHHIKKLKDEDRVLILETCTHTTSHEDIGRVKLPSLLKKKTGKNLHFDFYQGKSFPENLEEYALVLHCGGCMINRKHMLNRIENIKESALPITNYGVALAYLNGILEDSLDIFEKNRDIS